MADQSLEGAVIMQVAKNRWEEGQNDEALDLLENALAAFKKVDDTHNMSRCLLNIGNVLLSKGETQSACEAWLVALTIAQKYRYDDIAQTLKKNLDKISQSLDVNHQPPKKTFFQRFFKK